MYYYIDVTAALKNVHCIDSKYKLLKLKIFNKKKLM